MENYLPMIFGIMFVLATFAFLEWGVAFMDAMLDRYRAKTEQIRKQHKEKNNAN